LPNSDCAILVGVSRYANPAFPALSGPSNDVLLMKSWLTDPDGGGLDAVNVHVIESPDPLPASAPLQAPPTAHDFLATFCGLVFDAAEKPIPRTNARLYLYFSGHGFSQILDKVPRACLYTANATRLVGDNVPGTWYAEWTKDAAMFREIVVIMDCCRDAELSLSEAIPPLKRKISDEVQKTVQVFGIYAAPRGGKAQERPIPSREGKTYSLLTHALVDALNRAPTNEKFEVTSDSIAAHIRQSWSDICGADPADPPEFSLPGITPITIVKRPTVAQDLDVSGWGPGEPVELLRGDTEPLATLIRLIGDKVQVSWKTRADETIAIVNGHITINLVAGFCILRRGTVQRAFQSGEANVVI